MKKIIIASGIVVALSTSMFANGSVIFKRCISCHGAKAEKKFANKVTALNTLDKDSIITALKEYKTGANKFGMGAMMKGVAKSLSDKNIEEVADYIQTLK